MTTQTDSTGSIVPENYDVSNATKAHAYAQVTVTTTATLLSTLLTTAGAPAIPTWALTAFVTPETLGTPALRCRSDGTPPTASIGQPIQGWQNWPVQDYPSLTALQLISATGGNVTVSIEFRG
jgi:hypothetical protein